MTTASFPVAVTEPTQALVLRRERILERWLAKTDSTKAAYTANLERFRRFLEAPTLDSAAEMFLGGGNSHANGLLLDYQESLLSRGVASATVNSRVAAVRSLVKIARQLGMITWSCDIDNLSAESYRDVSGPGLKGFRAMMRVLDESPD